MFKKMIGGGAVALTLALIAAQPASAQDAPGGTIGPMNNVGREVRIEAPTTRQTSPSRVEQQRRDRSGRNRREAPAAPTQEALVAEAQAALAATGKTCQVSGATHLGRNDQQQNVIEVACGSVPGFIVVGSTPPQTQDCWALATLAEQQMAAQAAAPAGSAPAAAPTTCKMPGNTDFLGLGQTYAREAGLTCQVDQARPRGTVGGQPSYEMGCAGADGGYVTRTAAGGWTKQMCLQLGAGECSFTTPAEQAATVQSWLAGSPAANCNASQAAYRGQTPSGAIYYEAKCASGDGYLVRMNAEGALVQAYLCSAGQLPVTGGCTLSPSPAAAAAPAPAARP